jgi:hypothetical protein
MPLVDFSHGLEFGHFHDYGYDFHIAPTDFMSVER